MNWEAEMKLKEQLERKIKAQGKSPKTSETYWHYCEDFLRKTKMKDQKFICGFVLGAISMLLIVLSFSLPSESRTDKTAISGEVVKVEIPGRKPVAGFINEVCGVKWVTFPSDTMNMEGVRIRFSETSTAAVYPEVDSVVVRVGPIGGIID